MVLGSRSYAINILGLNLWCKSNGRSGDSHFWASLMKVKRDFLRFGNFVIKDGSQVRFWEDIWLGNSPLREQYPQLYNIVKKIAGYGS